MIFASEGDHACAATMCPSAFAWRAPKVDFNHVYGGAVYCVLVYLTSEEDLPKEKKKSIRDNSHVSKYVTVKPTCHASPNHR
jgi:hypothetical protein